MGVFFLFVLIDDAGVCDQMNNAGKLITKKKIKEINGMHVKYVDDHSLTESVDMTSLSFVPREIRPQPNMYRAHTGHVLDLKQSKVFQLFKETQGNAKKWPHGGSSQSVA